MPRRSIADIRREEIIDAFYSVVSKKGFTKATTREIAKAAGCRHGLLHHYFANKEEIVQGFVEYVSNEYLAELEEGISKEMTATDRLEFMHSYVGKLSRFTLDFCRAWVECWALGNSHPAVSRALNRCYRKMRKILIEVIQDGMEAGEFRTVDPTIAANLILSTSEGTTMLWVVNTKDWPVESVNRHVAEFCLSYLKKER